MVNAQAAEDQRKKDLGCFGCRYSKYYHPTCEAVKDSTLAKCPYRKENKE